jgi:hypothetical protein
LVHISCELFLACVFVSSRDAPTLAITTTDLKPSGYPTWRERKKDKPILLVIPTASNGESPTAESAPALPLI